MNYANFVKKLQLPPVFSPPARLMYDDLVATAISRQNLSDDVRGINASIELIRRTRGGGWPTEPVTEEFNLVDVVWHECEFREGYSFTYAVHDTDGAYLGCQLVGNPGTPTSAGTTPSCTPRSNTGSSRTTRSASRTTPTSRCLPPRRPIMHEDTDYPVSRLASAVPQTQCQPGGEGCVL